MLASLLGIFVSPLHFLPKSRPIDSLASVRQHILYEAYSRPLARVQVRGVSPHHFSIFVLCSVS